VTSARRLYRLHLGLGALAGSAVVLSAAVAVTRLEPGLPSTGAILAACRRVVPLEPGPGLLLILAFVGLGLVVFALAARSLVRQLRDQRRFLRGLRRVGPLEVGGHRATLFESERPQAFCGGCLRPWIYISTAARDLLSPAELRAVIAHEAHHRANRDPLRILLARLVAESLFFLPGLRRLSRRYRELAELGADEAATRFADERILASALLSFGERQGAAGAVVGIAPERVDHLLGQGPRWQLPLSILLGSLVIVSALFALTITMPAVIDRESVSLAMLLAEACMVAMAAAPVAVAAGAVALSRTRLQRARAS
jgi:Zn-dependent protease with chaperone function